MKLTTLVALFWLYHFCDIIKFFARLMDVFLAIKLDILNLQKLEGVDFVAVSSVRKLYIQFPFHIYSTRQRYTYYGHFSRLLESWQFSVCSMDNDKICSRTIAKYQKFNTENSVCFFFTFLLTAKLVHATAKTRTLSSLKDINRHWPAVTFTSHIVCNMNVIDRSWGQHQQYTRHTHAHEMICRWGLPSYFS